MDKSEFDQCLSDIQHIHKSLRLIHQIGMQHWRQRRKKIHYLETLYDKEIKWNSNEILFLQSSCFISTANNSWRSYWLVCKHLLWIKLKKTQLISQSNHPSSCRASYIIHGISIYKGCAMLKCSLFFIKDMLWYLIATLMHRPLMIPHYWVRYCSME